MEQPKRIPVSDQPTMWNKEMAIGAVLGTMIFPLVGTLIGGYIGGGMGEQRMRHEQEHGREVREPTTWNKGALLGGLIGLALVGPLVGFAAALGALTIGGSVGGGYMAMLAGLAGGTAISAFIGGQSEKRQMERDQQLAATLAAHPQSRHTGLEHPHPEQERQASVAQGKHAQMVLDGRQRQQMAERTV